MWPGGRGLTYRPVYRRAKRRSSSRLPLEAHSRGGHHSNAPWPLPVCGHWSARIPVDLREEGGRRGGGGEEEGLGEEGEEEGGGLREEGEIRGWGRTGGGGREGETASKVGEMREGYSCTFIVFKL